MKKVLIFIIVFLSFSIFVYADDEISSEESNLSPKSQEQIKAADEATKSYCDSNSEVKGCLYNESDTKYTSITKNFSFTRYENVHGNNSKPVTTKFSVENVPLTRGYQAFNGNGEAIFAGCYKYVYNPAKLPDNPAFVTGDTIFFFKFIFGKNCKEKHLYVVPAEGTRNRISTTSETATYDGTKAIVTSAHLFQFATFNEWKATRDAACPNIFGYTSNTRWYTSSDHIYVFSNNSSDFDELKAYSFWKNEEYKTRPGCTVSDEAGENENQVLLDEILNDIKGRTCPAKIEDMKTMNEEMQEWYESLRNNNKYRELWSRSLSDEVTVNDVQNQILAAIKEKLNSCMYNICGLTSSEITTINSKKGSACKNGCTLHRSETQSNSENAQCYACDNDKVLTWTENPNKNTCELQKNLKKEQCIGT